MSLVNGKGRLWMDSTEHVRQRAGFSLLLEDARWLVSSRSVAGMQLRRSR